MSLVSVENVFMNFARLGILAIHCLNRKMKTKWKGRFFRKKYKDTFR